MSRKKVYEVSPKKVIGLGVLLIGAFGMFSMNAYGMAFLQQYSASVGGGGSTNWNHMVNFPSGCATGYFATSIGIALICTQVGWTQITGYPSACPANQFVIAVGATLTCAASSGSDSATTAQCTSGQFVSNVTESSAGVLTTICTLINWSSLQNFPAGCGANLFVTSVGATLTCVAPAQEVASTFKCVTAGQFMFNATESLAGVITGVCASPDWTKLINFPSACTAGQYVSGVGVSLTCSAVGWTQLTGFPSACAAGQYVSTIASTPICTNDNITFQSNLKTCTDVTSVTVKMAGFKLNYTTVGTGKVYVTINFQITAGTAALVNTKYQPAYGTGSAPACNAGAAGTVVGNQYEVSPASSTAAAIWSESVTIGITTLSASTTYWFDIQISDSTTGSWIYSLPQMTVTES